MKLKDYLKDIINDFFYQMQENKKNSLPIIILNWNGIDDTIECIGSVLNTANIAFHIWLIDNNSDNLEGDKLTTLYKDNPKITVLKFESNFGFAKAHIKIWDDVLSKSATKYIALLNNDTVVDPMWLINLVEFAKENRSDIVASKMINYYNRAIMDNAGHRMLTTGEIIPIGHNCLVDDYNQSFETIGACGGGLLYNTKMLKEIGFFDPYFSTGYEDAELGLRAVVSGFSSHYCPTAIVYHKMGKSIRKVFNKEYSMMIHKAILYSYFKCMPSLNIVLSIPSFLFKYISMILIDIIFWRPDFLHILIHSWISVVKNEGNWLLKRKKIKRRRYYFRHNMLISFLPFDIERFWRIIVKKEKSALDSY